ncbi:MAG: polysaccharide deacetylase family protein [Gemmatimonadales bacterium]|nr:polysaccharide deacetylase family protein [Gemmatimonadales bacterium]
MRPPSILPVLVAIAGAPLAAPAGVAQVRTIAITIDDLPAVGPSSLAEARTLTRRLVAGLQRARVPAVGFVNAHQGELHADSAGWAGLLAPWLDAGLELANHTWSHRSLSTTPLDAWLADADRGAAPVAAALAVRGKRLRWFRHPYLHTGPTPAIRDSVLRHLAARGQRIAPVTAGHFDWLYAAAYDSALRRGDRGRARRVADAWASHLDADLAAAERLTERVTGRVIPQVLLLHANPLIAGELEGTLAVLRRRGYALVSLDAALADPAWAAGDPYAGPATLAWPARWAWARDGCAPAPPSPHGWVAALAALPVSPPPPCDGPARLP